MFQEDPDFIQYLSKTDAHESASDVGVDLSTSVPDQSPITATLVPGTLPLIFAGKQANLDRNTLPSRIIYKRLVQYQWFISRTRNEGDLLWHRGDMLELAAGQF